MLPALAVVHALASVKCYGASVVAWKQNAQSACIDQIVTHLLPDMGADFQETLKKKLLSHGWDAVSGDCSESPAPTPASGIPVVEVQKASIHAFDIAACGTLDEIPNSLPCHPTF